MAAVLADARAVEPAAEVLAAGAGSIHIGRGFSYPFALESALKVKETSAVPAEGASTADFLHGPIAAASHRPAVCYALPGPVRDDVAAMVQRLSSDGSPTIALGAAVDEDDLSVSLPGELPEPLSAVPLLVRAQQLALAVARRGDVDPDHPTGLNKITRTS